MYVFTGMPWVIAFEEVEIGDPIFIFEMFLDVCFTFDIFITLNTALPIEGEKSVITDRKIIFKSYLKGMLLMDILAVIPFYLVTES